MLPIRTPMRRVRLRAGAGLANKTTQRPASGGFCVRTYLLAAVGEEL